jgi:DNA-binding FadR family transcriptional regulator
MSTASPAPRRKTTRRRKAAQPLLDDASGASRLAGEIRRHIAESGLSEGDVFATEAQLAEQFGVSRRVAREAVNYLRALGILRVRRRIGLIVGAADPVRLMSRSVSHFARESGNLAELARLRYVLEVGAVDLAVANITPEQVALLGDLAAQFSGVVAASPTDPDRGEVHRIELAFHRAILEATGSALIAGMHGVLADFFAEYMPHIRKDPQSHLASAWQHQAIADAFSRRDVEQARSLLRLHLHETVTSLEGSRHADPAKH